jgi:thiamine pyrophosphate-dependent acetolactate synthase large subunit-like protein
LSCRPKIEGRKRSINVFLVGGVAQVIKHLASKCKALSSNLMERRKERKKRGREAEREKERKKEILMKSLYITTF